jgi:DNA-directed RNA polymerase subunit M/transcription elongation factor TFIIS
MMGAVAKSRKSERKRTIRQPDGEEPTIPFRFIPEPPTRMIPDVAPDLIGNEDQEPETAKTPQAAPASTAPECPDCGCRHVPVLYTRSHGKSTTRRRRCRHCLREFSTREIVIQ